MELKKLAPWNWFKKEEEEGAVVPSVGTTAERPVGDHDEPLAQFQRNIDNLFQQVFHDFGLSPRSAGEFVSPLEKTFFKPSVNISGNEKNYTVSVEIPGVDKKDVNVEINEDVLTIKGEKRHENKEERTGYYRMESSYGAFRRVLTLPEDADKDNIKGDFKKGVLELTIPKLKTPGSTAKQIEIREAA